MRLLFKDYNNAKPGKVANKENCIFISSQQFSVLRSAVEMFEMDACDELQMSLEKVIGQVVSKAQVNGVHYFALVHFPENEGHLCLLYVCRKDNPMVFLDSLGIGFKVEETLGCGKVFVAENLRVQPASW